MDAIKDYWAQGVGIITIVFWFARLEAAVRGNEREVRRLQHQRNEDQAAHKEARQATNDMLAEMRTDIKELLRRRE